MPVVPVLAPQGSYLFITQPLTLGVMNQNHYHQTNQIHGLTMGESQCQKAFSPVVLIDRTCSQAVGTYTQAPNTHLATGFQSGC